jgi:hypothetical protein
MELHLAVIKGKVFGNVYNNVFGIVKQYSLNKAFVIVTNVYLSLNKIILQVLLLLEFIVIDKYFIGVVV